MTGRASEADLEPGSNTLSDRDFAVVQRIALDEAGLLLPPSKRVMVQSRLARRLRATGCATLTEYIDAIRANNHSGERAELISVLTTNVTSFFREVHHFHTLAETVLPPLLENARTGGRLRLWSAGCSSGEEAFSLAMLITELEPNAADLDIRILATDVDQAVLSRAREGLYKHDCIDDILPHVANVRSFATKDKTFIKMPEHLRRLVSFKHLNLHGDWPMQGVFDIIMCRNVVIYFDGAHQARLWPRFHRALSQGGWLFLGHSERIQPLNGSGFVGRGLTAYQKSTPDHP